VGLPPLNLGRKLRGKATMTGSGSRHGDGRTIPDAPAVGGGGESQSHRPGFAVAGIICLTLIVGGSWFALVFAMSLTREYGVDTQGIGLDDVVGAVILSIPGFGLALLGVWFLRRSGLDRSAGWVCLASAGAIVALGVAGVVLAVAEFADTEGTGPILASRSGGVLGLAMAFYLAWAGLRFLDIKEH
jgi:hypothetical protein